MHRWQLPILSSSKFNNLLRRLSQKEKLPDKHWRRLWHLAGGLFFPILAIFVPGDTLPITLGVVTALFVILEAARFVFPGINNWLILHLGAMLKSQEHFQPTGSTSLLIASLVVFSLFEKDIAITSLLFVAIGDLAASIIGDKYGRQAVINHKTMEGSLACLISCLAIGMVISRFSPVMTISMAIYGAAWATLIEMLPLPMDDNFSMPVFSALAMAAVKSCLA